MISKTHNAFVEGREILDVVLVVNEAIDLILKSNKGDVACKLDLEKAYVDWSFLSSVMSKMGFEVKWIKLDILVHFNSMLPSHC